MKRIYYYGWLLAVLCLLGYTAHGQTSYQQHFDGATLPTEWQSSGDYTNSLLAATDQLLMQVDKTSQWSSFNLELPTPIDVSSHPYIKMELSSSVNYSGFSFLLYDSRNTNPYYTWSGTYSISTDGTTVFWDFSDQVSDAGKEIDWTDIAYVRLRVNTSEAIWNEDLTIDYFYIGEAAAPSTDKDITGFTIPGVSVGTVIDETEQEITIDIAGTYDITDLTSAITISGTSVSPESGVSQDFSTPITYTVMAEDGSTKDYTVSVREVSKKEITAFGLENMEPVAPRYDLDNHTIIMQLQKGIDRSALKTYFSLSDGATAWYGGSQISSGVTPVDFSSGSATIQARALDGSTQDWTINVYERTGDNLGLDGVQLGLGGVSYYGVQRFANYLYLENRNWRDQATGDQLYMSSPQIDENGYPLYLDAGQVLYAQPGQNSHAPDDLLQGMVVLTWQGEADIRINQTQTDGSTSGMEVNGRRVYNISGNINGMVISIHEINPADPPQKIRVWLPHPDDPQNKSLEPTTGAPESVFHPTMLDMLNIEQFSTYRFMDWGHTNANPSIDWSDRRLGTHCFMGGVTVERASPGLEYMGWDENNYSSQGIAFERMIEICNITGKNMWICVPHAATDDFVRKLALLIRGDDPDGTGCAGLDDDLELYVEFSNEIWAPWSTNFPQGTYALKQGEALWGEGSTNARSRWIGYRNAEVWSIFQDVLGDNRIKRVLGLWTGGGETRARATIDEALSHGAEIYPPSQPDAMAITTYFGNSIQEHVFSEFPSLWDSYYWNPSDDNDPTNSDWEDVPEASLNEVFDEWVNRILSGEASSTGQDFTGGGGGFGGLFSDLSEEYGLDLVAYEGGTGLALNNFKKFENCEIVTEGGSQAELVCAAGDCYGGGCNDGPYFQFIKAMHKHQRMAEVYYYHNTLGKAKGMTMSTQFGDIGSITKYGWYPFLEHMTQDLTTAYKYQFVKDWVDENKNINNPVFPVANFPTFVSAGEIATGREGVPYEQYIYYTKGDGSHSFTNLGGLLPDGINYQQEDGSNRIKISGTPTTEGIYRFIFRLLDTNTDSSHDPAYMVITFRVLPAPLDTVFAYDDFTTDSVALHGADGGYGFDGTWSVQNSATNVFTMNSTTPLSYAGLQCSGGKYAQGGGEYKTSGRKLHMDSLGYLVSSVNPEFIGQSNTSTWISFLVRRDAGTTNKMVLYCLDGQYPQSGEDSRFRIGVLDNGNWGLAIRNAADDGFDEYDAGVAAKTGDVELIVAEIKYGASQDMINLYLNPTSLGGGAPETPDLIYTSTEAAYLQFNRLGFYGTNQTDMVAIDDIRIGDSYKAVTPPDNPDNLPPVAYYVSSAIDGESPLTITFDGSNSTDEDGTIVSYKWDFGDGSPTVTETTTSSISHTYTSAGTYTVKLTVTDDHSPTAGTGSYIGTDITVIDPNQAPTASFTNNVSIGKRPLTVELDASASSDPDGEIALYQWDMGDGSPAIVGQTTDYVYDTPGDYTITLTVYDELTASGTATTTITVESNSDPVAGFTYTTTSPFEVDFDAGTSSDPDGTIASYVWDFNDGTTGSGQTVSHSFATGRTYRVSLTVTDQEGATHTVSQDIIEPGASYDLTWDGSASSDWFTLANWTPEERVPTDADNVSIPEAASYTNAPVITGTTTALCQDLLVDNTAVLTVDPGASLTVSGDLTVDASGELILESPENSGLAGSLITNGAVSGAINAKRFIQAWDWHYITSPVAGLTTDFLTDQTPNVYEYNGSLGWENGWQKIEASQAMPVGKGYAIYTEYEMLNFEGTPYSGDQTLTVTYHSIEGNTHDGWNLLGNPFPSAIDWEQVTTTNTENTVYYYNADLGGGTSSVDNYAYYNFGGFGTDAPYGLSLNGGLAHIMPHQAFFVRALPSAGTSGANLIIPQAARLHATAGIFLKNKKKASNLIRLKVLCSEFCDETVVRFLPSANDAYDTDYDAIKMFTRNENMPQLYSLGEQQASLAINSLADSYLSDQIAVHMGLRIGQAGSFTIEASSLESFDENLSIYLIDKYEEETIDLRKQSAYVFSTDAGDYQDRFELSFKHGQVAVDDLENDQAIAISAYNKTLKISVLESSMQTGQVEVYNTLGQKLMQAPVTHGTNLIECMQPAGVYLIKVITDKQTKVQRVWIQ